MTERHYGILGTVIIHNIILLLLLFSFLNLPSPVPTEGGILINFGDIESAGGPTEPELNKTSMARPENAQPEQARTDEEKDILTQDYEEAPAIKQAEKKPEPKPADTKSKPVEKPRTVNTKALYSNKGQSTSETGTSEGLYKGNGNMGDPTGTAESDNYSKGLGGAGIVFNLNGRNPVFLKKPEFNIHKEGIVVVEITVNRDGKVISATPGIKGSTIVDNTLYNAARKAALESKFNLKTDAPERQIGTIAYHFKLE
jgi:outer membrane biosynthesis protein TonB